MIKLHLFSFAIALSLVACGQQGNKNNKQAATKPAKTATAASNIPYAGKHFEGTFSDGMKGAVIKFDISPDGKKLNKLTYQGYWRCEKIEYANYAPNTGFDIVDGKVKGEIKESDSGVAFTFMIDATITGTTATGVYKMTLYPGYCNTGNLKFTASAK